MRIDNFLNRPKTFDIFSDQSFMEFIDLPVTRSLGTLAPVSRAPEARCDNVSSSADDDNVRDNMMRELTVHTSALPGDQVTTESS